MAFDITGARNAGYSEAEIADHLGQLSGFDTAAARKSGYRDNEIMAHLSWAWAKKELPAGVTPSSAGGGRGFVAPKPEPTAFQKGLNFARAVKDSVVNAIPGATIPSAERAAKLLETPSADPVNGPSLIERRGAPVSQEYFDAARAGLSVATPQARAQAGSARGFRGSVAGAANRDIAAADAGGETVRGLSGSVNARADKFIKQGASADTARAKATAEITTGLSSPMQTAAVPYDEGLSDAVVRRAGDIGLSAAKIPPTVLKGFADMAQLATAGAIGADASGALDGANQWIDSQKSTGAQIKAAEFARHAKSGTGATAFNFLIDNPGFLLEQALPSLGSMALPVGASAAASRIAMASKWLKALPVAEQAAALEKIREAVTLGTTVAQNSADTFAETKGTAADRYKAAGIAAAGTLLAGKAFDGGAEKLIGRALSGAGGGGVKEGLLSATAKAIGKEGGQEFTEAVSQSVGQQVGETGQVDPRAAIRQGVIEGTIGAFVGGGVSVATHRAAVDSVAAEHGVPSKAAARIKDEAEALPAEQRAGFIRRAFDALERRGLAKKPGAGSAFDAAQSAPAITDQPNLLPEVVGRPAAPTAAELGWATDDATPAAPSGPAPEAQLVTEPASPRGDAGAGAGASVSAEPVVPASPEPTAQPEAAAAKAPTWQGQPIEPAGQPIAGPDGRQYQPVMLAGKPQFIPVDEITTTKEAPSADGAVRELPVAAERDAAPGGQPARGAEDAGTGGLQRDGGLGADAAGVAPGLRPDPVVRDGGQPDQALTTENPANVPTPQDAAAQGSAPARPQDQAAEQGPAETVAVADDATSAGLTDQARDQRPAAGVKFEMDGAQWTVTGHGKKAVNIADASGKARTVAPGSPTWLKMAQAVPADAPRHLEPPVRKAARQHPVAVRGSQALAEVSRRLGGMNPGLLADLSGKVQRTRVSKAGKKLVYTQWDNPAIPGVGPLFRSGGSSDLSEVARVLEDAGYLTPGTMARDPLGAQQQAQEIIRAELRSGGESLQVGNPDAIEAEARQRAESSMDDYSNPWEDFDFAPDDLEFSGFEDVPAEVQAAVAAITAEAEAAGIDIEAIRDEVARQIGEEAPQHEYEAAVQQSLAEALAEARRPAQQAQPGRPSEGAGGGRQAAEPAGAARGNRADRPDQAVRPEQNPQELTLESQTTADLREKLAREGAATKAEKAARAAEQERLRRDSERRDDRDRAARTVDDFQLGQSAEQQMSGMADMFGQQGEPAGSPVDRAGGSQPIPAAPAKPKKQPAAAKPADAPAQDTAQPAADIDAELSDALGHLGDVLGDIFGAKLNATGQQHTAGDLLPALAKVVELLVRKGFKSFPDAIGKTAEVMRADKRTADHVDAITPRQWRAAYNAIAERNEGADSEEAVASADVAAIVRAKAPAAAAPAPAPTEDTTNAPPADTNLERDRQDAEPAARPVEEAVRGRGDGLPDAGGRAGEGDRRQGEGLAGDARVLPGGPVAAGKRGDQSLRGGEAGAVPAGESPGVDDDQRGGGLGDAGVPVDARAAPDVALAAGERLLTQGDRQRAQQAADKIAIKPADADNIAQTLPLLLDGQREDVLKAEQRFSKPDGYGMMFTNQPGTGKTYTGLGVVKRFARQGKTNTLIVAPTDKVIEDWVKSGAELGLTISPLADTRSAGKGIVITTYANLGQNAALAGRDWDLVVHDEAHYLMQDKDGKDTRALNTLRAITMHPRGAADRHAMLYADDIAELRRTSDELKQVMSMLAAGVRDDAAAERLDARSDDLGEKVAALTKKVANDRRAVEDEVKAAQGAARPRVTFLSATPFAYEKAVEYAEGYLFDYPQADGARYNSGDGRERFFMQHFGYRMRHNKLTAPDSKVDSGLMQRQFNSWLKKSGALSGRMLDVEPDYDRRFVLVDSAIGGRIDEALSWVSESAREFSQANRLGTPNGFNLLSEAINERFDYLSRRYLLEAIKANEVLPHVREHLAMGRKVVVFHDYKKGGGFNPFALSGLAPGDDASSASAYNDALKQFNAKFGDLMRHPFETMASPIDLFKREIPGVLLFNGDVKPADRRKAVASFQNDDNGPQVILVQSAAGKEGISLHDVTGKHQRVLFNLGQPTQPTTAIQQEGRIYRTGQKTDAIIRYLNTGTNWERWAFATTIAERASAAENLGLGETARALKDGFIAAFEASSPSFRAGMDGEGKGGKERDRASNNALTEYDRARSFYFGTEKKTQATKAQEGKDYFATPEPLGLKLVQWLDLRGGEKALEPSAGHGAIARWMPSNTERTAIEPSLTLRSRLAMSFDGNIVPGEFEALNIVNKFDGIAMNPPFGVGGKTAVEHLAKAAGHLREGGRLAAIIPTGPSADKRFEAWLYGEQQRDLTPAFEHQTLGPVYRGDMVTTSASFAKAGRVVSMSGDLVAIKVDGAAGNTLLPSKLVTGITARGPRTETYRPGDGFHLVADMKMPPVTFERAGTGVSTRVVVIERQIGDLAPPQQVTRDLTGIEDINKLFDALEEMSLPPRAKPRSEDDQPASAPYGGSIGRGATGGALPDGSSKANPRIDSLVQELNAARDVARGSAKNQLDGAIRMLEDRSDVSGAIALAERAMRSTGDSVVHESGEKAIEALKLSRDLVEYTTGKGKTLKGVIRSDLTPQQAAQVDPYTFKHKGGYFIREKHLEKLQELFPAAAAPRFSRTKKPTGERNLIVAHNLSADNLRAALEIGGLPAPSLAITKADAPIQGFGEITLIGDTKLATPGAKNPIFDADVYSPRFPDVKVKVDEKVVARVLQPLADAAQKAGVAARGRDSAVDGMSRNRLATAAGDLSYDIGMRLGYANAVLGKNLTAPTKTVAAPPTSKAGGSLIEQSPLREALQTIDVGKLSPKTSGDLGKKVYAALVNKVMADMGAEANTADGFHKAMSLANRRIQIFAETTIESGSAEFEYDKVGLMTGRGLTALLNSVRNSGGPTEAPAATRTEVDIQALNEMLDREAPQDQFEAWLREQLRPAMGERRVVNENGRTAEFTLDNIVKAMTRKVRDAEGFNYGLGNARSKGATKFKSLAQIQGRRDQVVSREEFEAARKEIDAEFDALSEAVAPFRKYPGDSASELLAEAIGNSYSGTGMDKALQAAALEGVPVDLQKRIAEFSGALVGAPTEYFEAKPQRAVSLGEFRGAVIPSDAAQDVRQSLESLGMKTMEYRKGDNADRARAVLEMSGALDADGGDVLFSRAGSSAAKLQDAEIQRVTDSAASLSAGWANAPQIVVVANMADPQIPASVREAEAHQRSQGAIGAVEGFFHDGAVYLSADALPTHDDVARVLYHETLGHAGLRGAFGDRLDSVLDRMARALPDRVAEKARQYGLDMAKPEQRREAAEELLAELAQTSPSSHWVKTAVAKVREFLRALGVAIHLSDNDIAALYLAPARGWVERGGSSWARGAAPVRFSAGQIAQEVDSSGLRAESTGKISPITRKPEFRVFDGAGNLVNTVRSGASTEAEAIAVTREMLAKRLSSIAEEPAVSISPEPEDKKKRSNWKLVRSDEFSRTDGDDGFLYHVTSYPAARSILVDGLVPGSGAMFGHQYAAHSSGRVFMTERSGVNFWREKVEQQMHAKFDRPPAVAVVKIERSKVTAKLEDDKIGSTDARARAYYAQGATLFSRATAGAPRFSRRPPLDPVTESALNKAGLGKPGGIREKLSGYFNAAMDAVRNRGEIGDSAIQGGLDQFYGIKRAVQRDVGSLPVEQDPYIAARLANSGTSAVMRALMLHGQARWVDNGQHLEKIPGTRGLLDIFGDLGPDLNNWFGWMIGNRAAALMAEGRENNFTAEEIVALRELGKGKEEKFRAVAKEYAAFKGSVLDVAERAGLIDAEARKVWDKADYIPFYRQMDETGAMGATGKKGLSGQSSGIRTLRGGAAALNDPMENILMNFSRLIDASLKNNALKRTVDVLGTAGAPVVERIGYDMKPAAIPGDQVKKVLQGAGMPQELMGAIPPSVFAGMAKMWAVAPPADPDVIRIMRNGKPEFYRVHDALLLRACTSFVPFDFPGLGVMRAFKRVLTRAVTASPEFMLRNFIRDAVAAGIITRDGFQPGKALTGIGKAWREDGGAEAMLFAGASFNSGNVNAADPTGTAAEMRRALRDKGMDAAGVESYMGSILDFGSKAWGLYRKAGDSIENATREAVYEATLNAGKSATSAAYEAKDLMDFSLRGSSPIYQIFADVLPFFNARVQGQYRLGRSDDRLFTRKFHETRLVRRGTVMMLASLALAAANAGDDEYEKLPDWDKDTSWHFWVGGHHFRVPKPFELGVAFATIPERIMRYAVGYDTGKKTATRVWENVRDQLAFDFVPQMFRPVLNVYANRDSFRGTPIESAQDEGKLPVDRYSASTSATAKAVTSAVEPLANATGMSPKRLEYLVSGYLGTVGMYAMGLSDMAVRAAEGDKAPRPAMRADDIPVVKAFYRVDPGRSSVFESDLYEMRRELGQIQKSMAAHIREGDVEKARAVAADRAKELAAGAAVERGAQGLAALNKQRDLIYRSMTMTPDEKRAALDRISVEKSALARRVLELPQVAELR